MDEAEKIYRTKLFFIIFGGAISIFIMLRLVPAVQDYMLYKTSSYLLGVLFYGMLQALLAIMLIRDMLAIKNLGSKKKN